MNDHIMSTESTAGRRRNTSGRTASDWFIDSGASDPKLTELFKIMKGTVTGGQEPFSTGILHDGTRSNKDVRSYIRALATGYANGYGVGYAPAQRRHQ